MFKSNIEERLKNDQPVIKAKFPLESSKSIYFLGQPGILRSEDPQIIPFWSYTEFSR